MKTSLLLALSFCAFWGVYLQAQSPTPPTIIEGFVQIVPLPDPTTPPVVSSIGASGTSTYGYQIVGVTTFPEGDDNLEVATTPSPVGSIATGNTILSPTNFNHLVWAPFSDKYAVFRVQGASTGLLGFTTDVMFDDKGQAPDLSSPLPKVNTTSQLDVDQVNTGAVFTNSIQVWSEFENRPVCDYVHRQLVWVTGNQVAICLSDGRAPSPSDQMLAWRRLPPKDAKFLWRIVSLEPAQ